MQHSYLGGLESSDGVEMSLGFLSLLGLSDLWS